MSHDFQGSSLGLRNVKLLKDLPGERLEELARRCTWRRFGPGQPIISREAQDRNVYLLVAGRVRVTIYSAGGRQVTFRDFAPGEFFGEVAAIDEKPRSADVVALDSVLIASMSPDAFRRLMLEEPLVGERVIRRLAGLVRLLSERVLDLSTLGVQNRIQAELLRHAREAGVKDNVARLHPAPKHADIASQISTYREQVTREFSSLTKAGVLAKDGAALLVCDVAKLQRMVEEVRQAS